MKTILRILERAGGYRPTLYLKIENPPFMALVIEATPEPGPCGLPAISIAHYGKQNGDPMRDPEGKQNWGLLMYQQDSLGPYQEANWREVDGRVMVRPALVKDLKAFARTVDMNLKEQGFLEAV